VAATLVQSTSATSSAGAATTTLGSAVNAGNLLIVCGTKIAIDSSHVFVHPGLTNARPFSEVSGSPVYPLSGVDDLHIAYRVATGDEQVLDWYASDAQLELYEFSGAASAATFEVVSKTLQAASSTKALSAFSAAGDAQVMAYSWAGGPGGGGVDLNQTVAAGWTQDAQLGKADPFGHYFDPGFLAAHATTGPTPSISGGSKAWAGIAIGITAPAGVDADFTVDFASGTAPLLVHFTDVSTGSPTAWSWDFGDGGTSTSQNPSHTYSVAGTYTVVLVASKTGSSSTATKFEFVVVHPAPAAGVYMDWDGDGFENGTYDDVASNVMSWKITRGASAEITGGIQPGTATLILKDPDGLYNPYNAASPLYGLLRDGVPVWLGPNADGALTGSSPKGLFAGRITDIAPIPGEGTDVPPTVEILCVDALGQYATAPIYLDYAEGRSHATLRQLALVIGGEDLTRLALDHEIKTMPLSHADGNLLDVLQNINSVNGTRHFIRAADNFSDWYAYTSRNRFWRLDGTSDVSLDAGSDHVTGLSGLRLSQDTVINRQRALVEPIVFTSGDFTVWEAETLPFDVTTRNPVSMWVRFDDVVRDPVLNIASTGSTLSATLTPYASTAQIDLSVASGTATVSALSVQGRLARRAPQESVVSDNRDSQEAPRGIRAGSDIDGEYLGVLAEARGIAEHITWRYGSPQARPELVLENKFPEMFERDLYDNLDLTSTQLALSGFLFEIVGVAHEGIVASAAVKYHRTTYVLQESRVQADPGWFYLDDAGSLLDDTAVLHH